MTATLTIHVPPPPAPPEGFEVTGFVIHEQQQQYPRVEQVAADRHDDADALRQAVEVWADLGTGRTDLMLWAERFEDGASTEVASSWVPHRGEWTAWRPA